MDWATLQPVGTPTSPGALAETALVPTSEAPAQNLLGGEGSAPNEVPLPAGAIGVLLIPKIGASLPVFGVSWSLVTVDTRTVGQWQWAAAGIGYHRGTAWPGKQGNCVLSLGPEEGEVAGRVGELAVGDELEVVSGTMSSIYKIVSVTKVREVGASLQERREHAACMAPTDDARLTFIACWPGWACTHRLVFVAQRKMVAVSSREEGGCVLTSS